MAGGGCWVAVGGGWVARFDTSYFQGGRLKAWAQAGVPKIIGMYGHYTIVHC